MTFWRNSHDFGCFLTREPWQTIVGADRRDAPLRFKREICRASNGRASAIRAYYDYPRLLHTSHLQNYTFLLLLLHFLTRYFAIFSTKCGVGRKFSRLERAALETLWDNGFDALKAQVCNVWTARTLYFDGKSVLFSQKTRCLHTERSVFSTRNKYVFHPKEVSFTLQTSLVCISKEPPLACKPIFGGFQTSRMGVQVELF